jgi:virginiamycin A acetyltransferase
MKSLSTIRRGLSQLINGILHKAGYNLTRLPAKANQKGTLPLASSNQMISTNNQDCENIGKYTYGHIQALRHCCCRVKNGAFCSIANDVQIGVSQHDSTSISTNHFYEDERFGGFISGSISKYFAVNNREVVVGNDVWIGTNVVILPNIRIGNGAIIGAGAVVTKDVPDFAIVGGVPAKIIKYRFSKEEQDIISLSQWWNWSDDFIKSHITLFSDNKLFMEFVKNHFDLIKDNLEIKGKV